MDLPIPGCMQAHHHRKETRGSRASEVGLGLLLLVDVYISIYIYVSLRFLFKALSL